MSLIGCDQNKVNVDSLNEIYSVYQTNGGTLSYEEWLNSIKGEKGETGEQGPKGDTGETGAKGADGYTPYIGENGNWWIGNEDTGYQAVGQNGSNGTNGTNGADGVSITGITLLSSTGNQDTYQITFSNNNTFEFTVTNGTNGTNGIDGINGSNGQDGKTPHIGDNGNWWIGDQDTGFQAVGHDGSDGSNGSNGADGVSITGITKIDTINNVDTYRVTFSNGNYFDYTVINGTNGAQGPQGETGPQGPQGPQGEVGPQGPAGQNGSDGVSVVSIEKTGNDGLVDTYTITYSNNTTSTFTVTNGANGQNGTDGAAGAQGIQGNPGADGHSPIITIGANGNWFVDNEDTGIHAQGTQGETGPQGPQGNPGADGATILTGSENPQNTLGKDGDMYLNTSSYDVFEKVDGEWTLSCNIKGLKGDTGVSIVDTEIDENGDLIVTFSNDQVVNTGHVKDVTKYTVNFYVDDDLVATKQVEPNSKIEAPSIEETAGYSINSWHVEGYNERQWVFSGYYADRVTENVNLYADFTYNQYTISFVDEKFNKVVESVNVTYDHEYSFEKTLSEIGYEFNGWKKQDETNFFQTSGVYRIASDVTLYSVWNAKTYNVTFNPNGGSCSVSEMDIIFDSNYTFPTPERTNYVFKGWYDGNNNRISGNATWKFDHNLTLTAQWTNITNTYMLDAGDGSCSIDSIQIGWEDPFELPTPTIDKTDEYGYQYSFVCWTLDGVDLPLSGNKWTYSNVGKVLIAKYSTNKDLTSKLSFYKSGNSYSVSGTYSNRNATSVIIPPEYDGLPVTTIRGSAFDEYSHLTNITIPTSITDIYYCAFYRCSSLEQINLPNSIVTLGESVFYGCSSLKVVNIPSSIQNIPDSTFNSCVSLETFSIPSSISEIGNYAFANCSSLSSINIPDSVTSIGSNCFDGCSNLVEVSLPSTLTTLPENLLANCTSLEEIVIPEGVETLNEGLFANCGNLSSVVLPSTISQVDCYLFTGCSSLTSISISENNEKYDSRDNCLAIIETDSNQLVCGSPNTTIPLTVTSLGANAFASLELQDSFIIPSSIVSIGEACFKSSSLPNPFVIPDSVSSIRTQCFSESDLVSVTLSSSLSVIPELAFAYCNNLVGVLNTDSIGQLKDYAFLGCSFSTITLNAYRYGPGAFAGCSNLESFTFPNKEIFYLNSGLFSGCTSLKTVDFNNTVKYIYPYFFDGCRQLESVTSLSAFGSAGAYAFRDCVSLTYLDFSGMTDPDDLKEGAFYNCSSLRIGWPTKISSDSDYDSISDYLFYNCSSLPTPSFSVGNEIGNYAFYGCKKIIETKFSVSIKRIGNFAYYGCTSLSSIGGFRYSPNLQSIGAYAFYGCTSISHVNLGYGNFGIGEYAFYNLASGATIDTLQSSRPSRWSENWTNATVNWW